MVKTISISFIFSLFLASVGTAQEYRLGLDPPAIEIYKSMLEFAETKNYDKITGSWEFLGDIPMQIHNKFGINLEKEINNSVKAQNRKRTVSAVRKLIFYDIKDIFSVIVSGQEVNPAYLKGLIKAAYLDYLQLTAAVEKTEAKIDDRIKQSFKEAFSAISEVSTASVGNNASLGLPSKNRPIHQILSSIENDIQQVFPDFMMSFTTPSILVHRAKPEYPNLERQAGIEGTVLVKVVVGREGKVLDAQVVKSNVTPNMDHAAVLAAKKCRFEPAKNGNLPVPSTVVIPFDFRL